MWIKYQHVPSLCIKYADSDLNSISLSLHLCHI